jgi:PPOX class probable F420-dependent enzyme
MSAEVMMPRAVHWFAALDGHQFINLTTFRKNGEPVATPVTFAIREGKLYVITGRTSGKVKRLRFNTHVQIEPSDSRGNSLGGRVDSRARVLTDAEADQIRRLLKFRAPAPVMFIFNRLRDLRQGGNVYLEICM